MVKLAGHERRLLAGRRASSTREEDAFAAVKKRSIEPGDVVVIRYEGPAGGPGMREMLHVTAAIVGEGIGEEVGPDHRRPLLRRHPRPDGGPRRARGVPRRPDRRAPDGDTIVLDVDARELRVELSDDEMAERSPTSRRRRRATPAGCSPSTPRWCRPPPRGRSPAPCDGTPASPIFSEASGPPSRPGHGGRLRRPHPAAWPRRAEEDPRPWLIAITGARGRRLLGRPRPRDPSRPSWSHEGGRAGGRRAGVIAWRAFPLVHGLRPALAGAEVSLAYWLGYGGALCRDALPRPTGAPLPARLGDADRPQRAGAGCRWALFTAGINVALEAGHVALQGDRAPA